MSRHAGIVVDAHVHLWDARHTPQPWMTEEHAEIARPFGPNDLRPLLERCGIDAVVLVQGASLDTDTDYLLEEAGRNEWIGAVTAWLALDRPAVAETRLDVLSEHPAFRAVRHLIHNEDDPHWILQPSVLASLGLLEEREIILELPVVFPRHLADVPRLGERFPELRIVIDHLGKPPLANDADMGRWEHALRAAAAYPNVAAKLSGLNTAIARSDWTVDDLLPACRSAIDAFGPFRLMCGSDWPVLLLNGDYERVWRTTSRIVEEIAGDHAPALLGENAADVYRFAEPDDQTTRSSQ